MAAKKTTKKTEKQEIEKKAEEKPAKYFYGVGRRKASIAQVRIYEDSKAKEEDSIVNNKKVKDYFQTGTLQNIMFAPLKTVGLQDNFRVSVVVRGGGVKGQAEAVRLGVARALIKFDENLRKALRDIGFLTRDSRVVERKKPGLKKARRAPQWQKR